MFWFNSTWDATISELLELEWSTCNASPVDSLLDQCLVTHRLTSQWFFVDRVCRDVSAYTWRWRFYALHGSQSDRRRIPTFSPTSPASRATNQQLKTPIIAEYFAQCTSRHPAGSCGNGLNCRMSVPNWLDNSLRTGCRLTPRVAIYNVMHDWLPVDDVIQGRVFWLLDLCPFPTERNARANRHDCGRNAPISEPRS